MEKIKDAKTFVHGQGVLTLTMAINRYGNQPVGSHFLLETHKTRISLTNSHFTRNMLISSCFKIAEVLLYSIVKEWAKCSWRRIKFKLNYLSLLLLLLQH